jgi:prepilin peptidase CpaA
MQPAGAMARAHEGHGAYTLITKSYGNMMIESGLLHIGDFFIPIENALLICLASIASVTDIVSRKIPNSLILAGLVGGALYQIASPYGFGLIHWLSGLGLGLTFLFPLYALRVMGAGDVKLMAAVGGFLGPAGAFTTLIYTLIAGGILALAYIAYRRAWKSAYENTVLIAMHLGSGLAAKQAQATHFQMPTVGHLPYAVAILAGILLHLYVFNA